MCKSALISITFCYVGAPNKSEHLILKYLTSPNV